MTAVKVESAIFARAFVAQMIPTLISAMVTARLSPCPLWKMPSLKESTVDFTVLLRGNLIIKMINKNSTGETKSLSNSWIQFWPNIKLLWLNTSQNAKITTRRFLDTWHERLKNRRKIIKNTTKNANITLQNTKKKTTWTG